MRSFTIDGRGVLYVPPRHRAPAAERATWVVDTSRASKVPPGAARVHVAPTPAHEARREGERRVAMCCAQLSGEGRTLATHPHALGAIRTALRAPRRDVVCHAADPKRRLRAYLGFREVWPDLRKDPDAVGNPALRGALELARRNKRFAKLVEAVGPPDLGRRPSSFASIARSIVYQQLSGAAAGTIWQRFAQSLPRGQVTPKAVLQRDVPSLRAVGLSNNKAASLLDLAAHIERGALEPTSLRRMSDDDVIDALVQVRGIGPWSAHMHLMFSLERLDVWPVGDLGVRKGLQRFLKLKSTPTERDTLPLGNRFAPYRSIAAWYMWRVLDVDGWA